MRPETSEKKEFALPAEQILQTASDGGNILFESGGVGLKILKAFCEDC